MISSSPCCASAPGLQTACRKNPRTVSPCGNASTPFLSSVGSTPGRSPPTFRCVSVILAQPFRSPASVLGTFIVLLVTAVLSKTPSFPEPRDPVAVLCLAAEHAVLEHEVDAVHQH